MQQHIKTPTRTTPDTKTLIYLIITKIEDTKVIDSGVIELGISDHDLVYICRKRPKTVETRQFNHFNTSAFQHDLCEVFKTRVFHSDPNIAWEEWREAFLNVANFHAPIRTRRVKSAYTPWLTDDIKKLCYHRDYLRKKSVRLNSTNYLNAYKKCRNQVTQLIKDEKAKYFNKKFKNCNNSKECNL